MPGEDMTDDSPVPVSEAARAIFKALHPHETWEMFDERFEARGNVLHPFQIQAIELADAAARSNPAAPATGGVPPDWVLVPREPTEAMRVAGREVYYPYAPDIDANWSAMLAATPPISEQAPASAESASAREAFLDLIADSSSFIEEPDEGGVFYYTLSFASSSLVSLMKALGIKQRSDTLWIDGEPFPAQESPAEAIQRCIKEDAATPPIPEQAPASAGSASAREEALREATGLPTPDHLTIRKPRHG